MSIMKPRAALLSHCCQQVQIPRLSRPPLVSFHSSIASRNALVRPSPSRSPNLPPNYPRKDYATPTVEVISFTSRLVRYTILTTLTAIGVGLVGFEGLHLYVERGPLSIPSRGNDEWGWSDEYQGWTGGPKGGTDPRLGWGGRHAVRAAWMCQMWGAGSGSGAITQGLFEPDYVAVRGVIGGQPQVRADRGYELAGNFLDVAIDAARKRGLVFPPALSVLRPPGPPREATTAIQGDPVLVDLLLLKAGILERIATSESLNHAKEIYEQVVCAMHSDASPIHEARIMRMAGKVGDLCTRMGDGDEAMEWWSWGLGRVGMEVPTTMVQKVKDEAKGWFGKAPTVQTTVPDTPSIPSALPPPVLRATISLLTSASAHVAMVATTPSLHTAHTLQSTALSLLPSSHPIPTPTANTAPMILHDTWLQHRSALLTLHLASVTHALRQSALELSTTAATRAEAVLSSLQPLPPSYTSCLSTPAKLLLRDALLLAAESVYTRGRLLERQRDPALDVAAECFERAMTLSAQESGRTDEETMGEEWQKYYRGFARVKERMVVSGDHSL